MNGGLLVAGLGVWVLCQVFGGGALGRLGIIDTSSSAPAVTPSAGAGPAAPKAST